jgi:two-component system CheB/CheR fusion protein
LTYAKESLQATVEELETSNEELQASNEELLASNEELQSSNEELQSVNEELHTVNAENQSRISELMDLSNDISNLLAISRVSVMLVDADLRIRRMSTGMADILGLKDEDNGAPLEIVSRSINFPNVIMMAQKVIREKREEEIEITNPEKSSKLLIRMIPYRKETGRIHGLILTAIDLLNTRNVIESRNH